MERYLIEVPVLELRDPPGKAIPIGHRPRKLASLYDETVEALGIDPAKLAPKLVDNCGCEWGGHGVYRL